MATPRPPAPTRGIGTLNLQGKLDVTTAVTGAAVLDQNNHDESGFLSGLDLGQSFTAGMTGILTRLELRVRSPIDASSASPGTLRIYAGEGFTGTLPSIQVVTFLPTPFSPFVQGYNLATPVAVTAGSQYTYLITVTAGTNYWVAGGGNNAGGRAFPLDGTGYDYSFTTFVAPQSNAATLVAKNGKVGIRTTNPQFELEVLGEVRANVYSQPSDSRWKKDIQPLAHALDTLTKLDGVSYLWRTEEFPGRHFPGDRQLGVIAQQVEAVVPSLVSTDEEGHKGVNYPLTIPLLIEAIKELKQQNDTLRAHHEALRAHLQSPTAQE